jgi:hypothetical protein
VSLLSKERRESFLHKCQSENSAINPDFLLQQFSSLMRVVQEEYVRQMKKCIVMKQMQDPSNHDRFIKMKVPVRLNKKTSPYFGVVRCPKYKFADYQNEILHVHWCSDEDMESMTRIFTKKCIEYQQHKYMQTNKQILKLPNELSDMQSKQKSHHDATALNILHRWREFLVGEIADKLKNQHNFFEETYDVYKDSHLKRIILRFEFIMNAYLRNFVKQSIYDWVGFIKSFTLPKLDMGELWARSPTPMLVIHLAYKKPAKDKKPKRKPIAEDLTEEEKQAEIERRAKEDEEFMYRLEYHPTPAQCHDFLQGALQQIIDSTNKVHDLESDLMKSLQSSSRPNFEITKEFPWVMDAKEKIAAMFEENIQEPLAILEKFKAYEYLLNVDRRDLVDKLFNDKERKEETGDAKAPLEEIAAAIEKYHQAAEEIQNLTNNHIDTPMFRVVASKIKDQLSNQAFKIRDKLIEAVQKWCFDTVNHIDNTFRDMQKQIQTPPTNEKELVFIREFINISKDVTQVELGEQLKAANKHYEMLELYSFMYKTDDIENTFFQKMWPMTIGQVIQDGKSEIAT